MKSNKEILELEKSLIKLENLHASFDYLRITIASPERIKSWSQRILPTGEIVGEVLRAETINFRTHQPEVNGLFCEKIFGPIKNWKCKCGKYSGFVLDKVCETCNVEITEARVRRYRMGYIDLTCPVAHLWYLRGVPNYLLILLSSFPDIDDDKQKEKEKYEREIGKEKLTVESIEDVIYFREGEEIISNSSPFFEYFKKSNSENELKNLFITNNTSKKNNVSILKNLNTFDFIKNDRTSRRRGAEIIKAALENINIEDELKSGRSFIHKKALNNLGINYIPDKKIIRRIRILESFLATKTKPEWMILTTLPVLPPNLRPLLELENGRLVAADVNEIYRLIITRNQRLFDFLFNYSTPELITVHGRKLLQEGIDYLIDNARLAKEKRFLLNNKALKSLTEILEGKQGRFRQSLLGKRVDYSGRSVIVVGPHLRLNQCGLPYEMACELFQPFLIHELLKTKIKAPSNNTKLAHLIIKKNKPFIWTLLISLTRKYSILLNRAPTLHRFGIQAFDPVMILGQAIQLHPLVCTGFNADFDGDQMAVHLPLYESSQLEARTMMRPSYNVLAPSNGDVILKPTQDMVIGCYYLTLMIQKKISNIQKWFGNENEALTSFYNKKIDLHTSILVRYSISNFEIKIENKKLIFIDKVTYLSNNQKEIIVYKIYEIDSSIKKYYLLCNIGILIARYINETKYEVTDLFLETTPGRLLFSTNFKNAIKTKNYVT
jgi:DNA-directed RNA polymerase subunit beta'